MMFHTSLTEATSHEALDIATAVIEWEENVLIRPLLSVLWANLYCMENATVDSIEKKKVYDP